jgi:hypothetical protein
MAKPLVIESKKDLNSLVSLLMSVNEIPEGKGIAMLLGDFESQDNFEAVKRWTVKTLWEHKNAKEDLVLNELCGLLDKTLQDGLFEAKPVGHH